MFWTNPGGTARLQGQLSLRNSANHKYQMGALFQFLIHCYVRDHHLLIALSLEVVSANG